MGVTGSDRSASTHNQIDLSQAENRDDDHQTSAVQHGARKIASHPQENRVAGKIDTSPASARTKLLHEYQVTRSSKITAFLADVEKSIKEGFRKAVNETDYWYEMIVSVPVSVATGACKGVYAAGKKAWLRDSSLENIALTRMAHARKDLATVESDRREIKESRSQRLTLLEGVSWPQPEGIRLNLSESEGLPGQCKVALEKAGQQCLVLQQDCAALQVEIDGIQTQLVSMAQKKNQLGAAYQWQKSKFKVLLTRGQKQKSEQKLQQLHANYQAEKERLENDPQYSQLSKRRTQLETELDSKQGLHKQAATGADLLEGVNYSFEREVELQASMEKLQLEVAHHRESYESLTGVPGSAEQALELQTEEDRAQIPDNYIRREALRSNKSQRNKMNKAQTALVVRVDRQIMNLNRTKFRGVRGLSLSRENLHQYSHRFAQTETDLPQRLNQLRQDIKRQEATLKQLGKALVINMSRAELQRDIHKRVRMRRAVKVFYSSEVADIEKGLKKLKRQHSYLSRVQSGQINPEAIHKKLSELQKLVAQQGALENRAKVLSSLEVGQ